MQARRGPTCSTTDPMESMTARLSSFDASHSADHNNIRDRSYEPVDEHDAAGEWSVLQRLPVHRPAGRILSVSVDSSTGRSSQSPVDRNLTPSPAKEESSDFAQDVFSSLLQPALEYLPSPRLVDQVLPLPHENATMDVAELGSSRALHLSWDAMLHRFPTPPSPPQEQLLIDAFGQFSHPVLFQQHSSEPVRNTGSTTPHHFLPGSRARAPARNGSVVLAPTPTPARSASWDTNTPPDSARPIHMPSSSIDPRSSTPAPPPLMRSASVATAQTCGTMDTTTPQAPPAAALDCEMLDQDQMAQEPSTENPRHSIDQLCLLHSVSYLAPGSKLPATETTIVAPDYITQEDFNRVGQPPSEYGFRRARNDPCDDHVTRMHHEPVILKRRRINADGHEGWWKRRRED